MIQPRTKLVVSDNSGAKLARCIKVKGGSGRKKHGIAGEKVTVAIISTVSGSKIKTGQVKEGLIVRVRSVSTRTDSSSVVFDDNAIVLIDKDGEPLGTRVFGPISREVKQLGFSKVCSLASEVV